MLYLSDLLKTVDVYLDEFEINNISKAYFFIEKAHTNQLRASGDPFIMHPIAVARILALLHADAITIISALLHDVIEDTETTKEEIALQFGEKIADIVDGVSKLKYIKFPNNNEAKAKNLRKMILASTKDIRVIVVKLADRLHNMRTIRFLSESKRRRISLETLEVYVPIACHLGMHDVQKELEELCFLNIYPNRYRIIDKNIKKIERNNKGKIDELINLINETILANNLPKCYVSNNHLCPYNVYKQIKEKKVNFKSATSIIHLDIITESIDTCYRILGLMHNLFRPIPGKFRDYIALAKANGYQALHTALFNENPPFRLDIRIYTYKMEYIAKHGILANWIAFANMEKPLEESSILANRLFEITHDYSYSYNDFILNLKKDLSLRKIYIFTDKGLMFELPRGSTPIDVAYALNQNVGDHCYAAKINGKFSSATTQLRTGQTVEIIVNSKINPDILWLEHVATAKARNLIRKYLCTNIYDEYKKQK